MLRSGSTSSSDVLRDLPPCRCGLNHSFSSKLRGSEKGQHILRVGCSDVLCGVTTHIRRRCGWMSALTRSWRIPISRQAASSASRGTSKTPPSRLSCPTRYRTLHTTLSRLNRHGQGTQSWATEDRCTAQSGNKKLAYHETKVGVFKDETDSVHDALRLWLETVVSHGADVAQRTADLYEYEAVFLPTLSRTIRQQDAIREYFDFFANLPGLRVVPTADPPVVNIKQYSSYMTNADGFLCFARSDTTANAMARFSFAYRKNYKGEWKITLHHNSRIPDFNAAVKEVENINYFPPDYVRLVDGLSKGYEDRLRK